MIAYLHKCHGPILLVGEGDFSFSLSLCKHLPQTSIVATCIEDDTPSKYRYAQQNINRLKEAGGNVIFGVDATGIESCELLTGKKFKMVIFNFPHTGRKARIQDNRQLLKNFFISASKCLASDGQVMLTLCNGQGGTPADKPQREFFNSWQVVAMATYADLILTHTEYFVAQEFPEYACTGYRGREKGFNTEGAIVHVFEKSPITEEPTASPIALHHQIGGCDRMFVCPEELCAYNGRNLLQDPSSPVCEVYHQISNKCTLLFNGLLIQEMKKCDWIREANNKCVENYYNIKEHHTNESDTNASKREDITKTESSVTDIISDDHPIVKKECRKSVENLKICMDYKCQGSDYILCPYVDCCILSDHDEETTKLLVGQVFRRCPINPKLFPITNEFQLFLPEQSCKYSMKEIVSLLIFAISPEIRINFEIPSSNPYQEGLELIKKDTEISQQTLKRLSELDLKKQYKSIDLRTQNLSKHYLMRRNIWMNSIREQCMKSISCNEYKEEYLVVTVSSETTSHEVGIIGKIIPTNAESPVGYIIQN